ncbi:MAG TPA: DUF1269 domain-containing protein [Solirubrobacteraceae bacterium]|jgi:uncharacterized membrane protein
MSPASTSFVAVGFQSAADAEAALPEVREIQVPIRDAAVVVRTEAGRIELQQTRELAVGEGLVGGGTVGLIAGLLLGLPVGGALLGLAGGALAGLRDRGIPDSRLRALGADLQPGHAVLCVLVDPDGLVPAREALSRYGTVFEVELAPESASGSDP